MTPGQPRSLPSHRPGGDHQHPGRDADQDISVDARTTLASLSRRDHVCNACPDYPVDSQMTTTDTAADAARPPTDPEPVPPASFPGNQVQFRSNTIAPSPPLARSPPRASSPTRLQDDEGPTYQPSPLGARDNLRLQTDVPPHPPAPPPRSDSLNGGVGLSATSLTHKTSASSLRPVSRTPSFKTGLGLSHGFGPASAASSAFPSPLISAMGDVTPLPSPLLCGDSPGPWKKLDIRPSSRDGHYLFPPSDSSESVLVTTNGESVSAALAHHAKRKAYSGLAAGRADGARSGAQRPEDAASGQVHGRNRSVSEYVPDPLQVPKRMTTVSGPHVTPLPPDMETHYAPQMRREPHLSEARGLTPAQKPPTPPPSESSFSSTSIDSRPAGKRRVEYFEAYGREDNKRRRWRAIKLLGQGTFSRVMLATSQVSALASTCSSDDDGEEDAARPTGLLTSESRPRYERRTLVAVKVCESGPKGGASEDRVEMSLKRELEIMQSINHASLVHLKAWSIEATRAILVLSYCPGGDLFDVASTRRELLSPPLLRRVFAELVGAVRYLHKQRIVHRDIKLENVLVNLPPSELYDPNMDWAAYPYSVATLTDLGLSRRVADDERLETRCGSDDYAAPEVIMGQPYDGRATDAWSLGVLLYALLEGRLPFDPSPGMADGHRMRSRTSHRIARVEWRWIEYAGDEGDHEGDPRRFEARALLGAMEITEGLLKRARSRWGLEKVASTEWVRGAIAAGGGIRFRDEEEGVEVL